MRFFKRFLSLGMALSVLAVLLSGCSYFSQKVDAEPQTNSAETAGGQEQTPSLAFQFESGKTTYYLWSDHSATDTPTYRIDSDLSWVKDESSYQFKVSSAVADVVVAAYSYGEAPALEKAINANGMTYYLWDNALATLTESFDASTTLRWEKQNDIYSVSNPQNIEIASFVIPALKQKIVNSETGKIYYCWADGVCTFKTEYDPEEGFTWTAPWEGTYIIYSGTYKEGHVVYSEKSCSWCQRHLCYYHRTLSDYGGRTELYLCSDCKLEFDDYYHKCSVCGLWCWKFDGDVCENCRRTNP